MARCKGLYIYGEWRGERDAETGPPRAAKWVLTPFPLRKLLISELEGVCASMEDHYLLPDFLSQTGG